jgi:hypothetical protein
MADGWSLRQFIFGAAGKLRAAARKRPEFFVLGIGFLLFLPGLASPYWLDDYVHRSMVRGTFPSSRSPFDLYNFVTDEDRSRLVDTGVLPWWTHPHLTIRFFRPLSSVLRWLDFTVSDIPALHHAHSVVWWVLAVLGTRMLVKQWLPPRPALMATVIFALAPCHAVPLAWLANREVLVSIAFGSAALAALTRYRKRGAARDAVLATALFACAMLGGEYSIALGGYVLAFELFVPADRIRRLVCMASFGVPAAVMLVARKLLGFGNSGSGFYRDPFGQTEAFVLGAPRRLARLLIDTWLASDSDWVMDTKPWIVGVFIVAIAVLIAIPVRGALAAAEDGTRRASLAFLLGSLLALVPMVAVLPTPRLLGGAMIGVAFVVAVTLEHGWFPKDGALKGDFTGVLILLFGFFHLVHGPVTSLLTSRFFHETSTNFVERSAWLRDRVDNKPEEAKFAVARCGWQTVLFSPFALEKSGALPARWWVLSLVPHALMLRRGERSIELVVPKGRGYFPTGPDDLFRSTDLPLKAGDDITVPGLHARVIEAGESGPGRVHFDFADKLEALVWIADGRDGWRDVPPPQIGFGQPLDP